MITATKIDPNFQYSQIVYPKVEIVTLDEFREFGRFDGEFENLTLERFLKSAAVSVEQYLERSLITQTWRLLMNVWQKETLELGKPPLISVTKIETADEENVWTEYDSTNYYVNVESYKGTITIKSSVSFPKTTRNNSGISVEFVAGYGPSPSDIPDPIVEAIMVHALNLYENRGSTEMPTQATALLAPFRVMSI